jgi:hypothetical protein
VEFPDGFGRREPVEFIDKEHGFESALPMTTPFLPDAEAKSCECAGGR